jgi:hypothetical protein
MNIEQIKVEIEDLRQELYSIADKFGLCHIRTLHISQALDRKLNLLDRTRGIVHYENQSHN